MSCVSGKVHDLLLTALVPLVVVVVVVVAVYDSRDTYRVSGESRPSRATSRSTAPANPTSVPPVRGSSETTSSASGPSTTERPHPTRPSTRPTAEPTTGLPIASAASVGTGGSAPRATWSATPGADAPGDGRGGTSAPGTSGPGGGSGTSAIGVPGGAGPPERGGTAGSGPTAPQASGLRLDGQPPSTFGNWTIISNSESHQLTGIIGGTFPDGAVIAVFSDTPNNQHYLHALQPRAGTISAWLSVGCGNVNYGGAPEEFEIRVVRPPEAARLSTGPACGRSPLSQGSWERIAASSEVVGSGAFTVRRLLEGGGPGTAVSPGGGTRPSSRPSPRPAGSPASPRPAEPAVPAPLRPSRTPPSPARQPSPAPTRTPSSSSSPSPSPLAGLPRPGAS